MGLRINTNISAMNAHKHLAKSDGNMSSSLERLSSGLRINKAADDASGMTLADSLQAQHLGLGQAVRNASDGINIVQTADAALEESINIINIIKTKSIQAAQDGQTLNSRAAIQADINKLLENLDTIANSTSFNNQKLLSGNFTDKHFQVGAYSSEIVNVSIATSQPNKIGHTTISQLTLKDNMPGTLDLAIYANALDKTFKLETIDVKFNNSSENGMGAMADAINKLSDTLGVSAVAVVSSTTEFSVTGGTTDKNFAINGITIGEISVEDSDVHGGLVSGINQKTALHGVLASMDDTGHLKLTSTDGRAIEVHTGGTGTEHIFGGTNMTTTGHIQLIQTGSAGIVINNVGGGDTVSFTSNLEIKGNSDLTSIPSVLKNGSKLAIDSRLAAGFTTGQEMTGEDITNDKITISMDSVLKTGSVIVSGSILGTGSDIGADIRIHANTASTTEESLVAEGSILLGGMRIGENTVLGGDITVTGDTSFTTENSLLKAGSILETGSTIPAGSTLGGDTITAGIPEKTKADSTVIIGSILASGSVIAAGTVLGGAVTLASATTTRHTDDSLLTAGSVIASGSVIVAGTIIGGDMTLSGTPHPTTGDSLLKANSIIETNSVIAAGSIFGANIPIQNDTGIIVQDSLLKAGSKIEAESIIGRGSTLYADLTLKDSVTTNSISTITNGILKENSILKAGTLLAVGQVITVNGVDYTGILTSDLAITGGDIPLTAGITSLTAGSSLASDSIINSGSRIDADLINKNTVILIDDMVLRAGSMLKANTVIANGSALDVPVTVALRTTLTDDMTLKSGSTITSGSRLKTGSSLAADFTTDTTAVTLTNDMDLKAGSTLQAGSVFNTKSSIKSTIETTGTTTITDNMTLKMDSFVEAGSKLKAGSTIAANLTTAGATVMDQDMTLTEGAIIASGSSFKTESKIGADITLVSGSIMTLVQDMTLTAGTIFTANSEFKTDSRLGTTILTADDVTLTKDTIIKKDSRLVNTRTTAGPPPVTTRDFKASAGSTIGGAVNLARDLDIEADFTVAKGSTIATDSVITNGSTIGGTITLANDETVPQETDLFINGGSTLKEGSVIVENTLISTDMTDENGKVYTAGSVLKDTIVLGKDVTLKQHMSLQNGSILKAGSTLTASDANANEATAELSDPEMLRLSEVNVLNQENAQKAIAIADSALKDLNKIRADLGAMQNQMASIISSISTTKVHVNGAESAIRDVDFAEESSNFTKMQILMQAGTFAMAQANASSQHIMTLLQQ